MAHRSASEWTIGRDEKEGRWARSWRMLGTSWRLLTRTPALRAVAAAACVSWLMATAILFGPVVLWFAEVEERYALVVGGAVVAYPFTFVTVFFSVALLAAASACMDGRRLTVRESFAVAVRRLPRIAVWALLVTGVGAVLDALAEWIPGVGHVASWVLGAAWSLATLFAIPILVLEDVPVRTATRRSATVFRERWGESLIGFVSITACTALASVPGCVLLCGGVVAGEGPVALAAVAVGVLLLAIAAFVATTMDRLFALTLYRYVVEGEARGGFTETDLRRGTFFRAPGRGGT